MPVGMWPAPVAAHSSGSELTGSELTPKGIRLLQACVRFGLQLILTHSQKFSTGGYLGFRSALLWWPDRISAGAGLNL